VISQFWEEVLNGHHHWIAIVGSILVLLGELNARPKNVPQQQHLFLRSDLKGERRTA